jgi:hypothetical protein
MTHMGWNLRARKIRKLKRTGARPRFSAVCGLQPRVSAATEPCYGTVSRWQTAKIALPAETALDALLDLIEWCRSERANLQRQLCALSSGKFRIGENSGTGWVDTTGTNIERISAAISELDQILAALREVARPDPRAVR